MGRERRSPRSSDITVHREGAGFAAVGRGLFVWDEDPVEVLDTAEAMRRAPDPRTPRVVRYAVDASDTIRAVGREWGNFARANDAAQLTAESVIGKPIWDFIAGSETRELYERVFERMRRRGGRVELPFSCDSPSRARPMRLTITPGPKGGLQFRSTLSGERYRVLAPVLERGGSRSDARLRLCSFCKRAAVAHRWLDIVDAMAELGLCDEDRPQLEHALCRSCRDSAGREMRAH